jgi:hypothetical protein
MRDVLAQPPRGPLASADTVSADEGIKVHLPPLLDHLPL